MAGAWSVGMPYFVLLRDERTGEGDDQGDVLGGQVAESGTLAMAWYGSSVSADAGEP